MDLEEKKYWVAMTAFPGIGPVRFKLLTDYFGSAKKAYRASERELAETGLRRNLVSGFLKFRSKFDLSSYFVRLKDLGIETVCAEEDNYPILLKEIVDRPPVIYIKILNYIPPPAGQITKIFKMPAMAVVGTRKVTEYGKKATETIVLGLVENKLVVVSGLARGVDGIAHRQAIDCKGLTIAVLGNGLDSVYPPEHKSLAEEVVKSGGALVSEFPLDTPLARENFPARNRIISGLSLGVVVTEAAESSGSLITASCAAEQGREVFAVPGPITSPLSQGTAQLIKKGAKLVGGIDDIMEELNL